MESILKSIQNIRGENSFAIDRANQNRYCVSVPEDDGSRTVYCFGVPVRHADGQFVDRKFRFADEKGFFAGTNCTAEVGKEILLRDENGFCRISLPRAVQAWDEQRMGNEEMEIRPSLNGVICKVKCKPHQAWPFTVSASNSSWEVRVNNKCLVLILYHHRPFVVASCIGTLNAAGDLIGPALLEYHGNDNGEHRVCISHDIPDGEYILYEINLREQKLFMDTTVESANTMSNNAFGSTAFIGNTEQFGEQWLYSRMDFDVVPEMFDFHAVTAKLYFPKLNRTETALSAHLVGTRFCSFESNWNNKIHTVGTVADSESVPGYFQFDLTQSLIQPQTKLLSLNHGWVFKAAKKDSGFAAISTGDSFCMPPILAVRFET